MVAIRYYMITVWDKNVTVLPWFQLNLKYMDLSFFVQLFVTIVNKQIDHIQWVFHLSIDNLGET